MLKTVCIFLLSIFLFISFSFDHTIRVTPHELVKIYYIKGTEEFKDEATVLDSFVKKGTQIQIQKQFSKTREAYKKVEVFVEYFFPFYAGKLNGPPIPFFEESEPEKGG